MTQQEILNSNNTKTWKIEQLLRLGLNRRETATLMHVGYGFVQNVFARTFPEQVRSRRRLDQIIEEAEYNLSNFAFNHTFGIEIEASGISSRELATELRNAGIETRAEGYNHRQREHWKITSDSSLRGSQTFELVSPKLRGRDGLRQLKTVTLILRGLEARLNRSCGVHIHFDARSFDSKTWKNLYKNYAKIEKVIDSFMPNSRRNSNNRFCKSMRVTNFERKINEIGNLRNSDEALRKLERKITRNDRYYKLNTRSYWRHGSVEFRQHSGTVNFRKIENWILFLARLVEFSKEAEFTGENWNQLSRFLPDEIINYYKERKNQLNSNS